MRAARKTRTSLRAHTAALMALGALGSAVPPLATAASAQAAVLPTVTTGSATQVSYNSATLQGTVDPKGNDTLYYFQYGATKAYGSQTQILDAGSGTTTMPVSVTASSLQPLTAYHYRLVAVNGAGAAMGTDQTFTTTKVPLSLEILASPDPVPFGSAVTIEGTLSGTASGNREVVLQANAFPFTAGFANIGNPELTTAEGGFSFHVLALKLATQYRVVTTTSPPVTSAVASVSVTPRVSAHARRLRGRVAHGKRKIDFYGTVAPSVNGARVVIVHVVRGHSMFVASTVAHKASGHRSRFNRVVRIRRGVYRVQVRLKEGGPLASTESGALFVR